MVAKMFIGVCMSKDLAVACLFLVSGIAISVFEIGTYQIDINHQNSVPPIPIATQE